MPGLFNSCRILTACLDGKLMANDLEAGSESPEPASDLPKLVGDPGIEPVISSVSTLGAGRQPALCNRTLHDLAGPGLSRRRRMARSGRLAAEYGQCRHLTIKDWR